MKKRFHILDGFRGLFALLVAIYHFAPGPGYIGYTRFISHASYFTDFFFVLSGFVIYYNYNTLSSKGLKDFLVKRFIRLYPLHFFMLIVFLTVEIFKMILYDVIPFENPPFDRNSFPSFLSHLFLIQSYGFPVFWGCWNAPSWSISAEFFSYFIFGLTIVMIRKYAPAKKILIYLLLSVVMLFILYSIRGGMNIKTEQFGYLRCAYSFFLGCIACIIHDILNEKKLFTKRIFSQLEIMFLIISVLSIMYVPAKMTFLIPVSFFATVLVFSFENGSLSSLLNISLFRTLGAWSYSIYMTHYLLMFVFKIGLINILKIRNPVFYDLMLIPYIILILLSSKITYQNIELKGKDLLFKMIRGTKQKQTEQKLSPKV